MEIVDEEARRHRHRCEEQRARQGQALQHAVEVGGGRRSRTDPGSWHEDAVAHPVDEHAPVTAWETAAALGAREVAERVAALEKKLDDLYDLCRDSGEVD